MWKRVFWSQFTVSRCFFSDSFPSTIKFRGKCDWMPQCQDGLLNHEFLFPEGLGVFSTNPLQPQSRLTPMLLTISWNLISFPSLLHRNLSRKFKKTIERRAPTCVSSSSFRAEKKNRDYWNESKFACVHAHLSYDRTSQTAGISKSHHSHVHHYTCHFNITWWGSAVSMAKRSPSDFTLVDFSWQTFAVLENKNNNKASFERPTRRLFAQERRSTYSWAPGLHLIFLFVSFFFFHFIISFGKSSLSWFSMSPFRATSACRVRIILTTRYPEEHTLTATQAKPSN